MTPQTIAVESRTFGRGREETPLGTVWLELLEERISVAELIRRAVEEQVRELSARRKLDAEGIRAVMDRHYLLPDEIAAQAKQGAVRYPPKAAPPLDAEEQVRKVFRAFQAGCVLILVNRHQVETLDEEIVFTPGSKVTFLRLTPLVGG